LGFGLLNALQSNFEMNAFENSPSSCYFAPLVNSTAPFWLSPRASAIHRPQSIDFPKSSPDVALSVKELVQRLGAPVRILEIATVRLSGIERVSGTWSPAKFTFESFPQPVRGQRDYGFRCDTHATAADYFHDAVLGDDLAKDIERGSSGAPCVRFAGWYVTSKAIEMLASTGS
jgi:hypothetical protein